MQLGEITLSIQLDNQIEQHDIDVALTTAKNVLWLTQPNPTLSFQLHGNNLILQGSDRELNLLKLVFRQTFGLMDDSAPVSMVHYSLEGTVDNPHTEPPILQRADNRAEEHLDRPVRATVIRASDHEDNPVQEPVREPIVVPPPTQRRTRRRPATTEQPVATNDPHYETYRSLQDWVRTFAQPSRVANMDDTESVLMARRGAADMELMSATVQRRSNVEQARVVWQTAFDRMSSDLIPTDSSSGSVTINDQIEYSNEQNPRRWNLVKTHLESGARLTYLAPPCVALSEPCTINGGVHNGEICYVDDVCVFNTEKYWRELRHMMHQSVEYLREVA